MNIIINEYPVKYVKTPWNKLKIIRRWYDLNKDRDAFVSSEEFHCDVEDGNLEGAWFKAVADKVSDRDLLFVPED